MIPLTRVRTEQTIHPNFRGQKRVNLNFKLLQQKRDGKLDGNGAKKWDAGIWKEAKDQLLVETHNKCAYCETPTRVVAYGDVEHFRPKSKYWWLAYCYENYLASCTACNQEYKKDHFDIRDPVSMLKEPEVTPGMSDAELRQLAPAITVDPLNDNEGKPLAVFIQELQDENALIVHPYFDNPATYYAYAPVLETKQVFVVPASPEFQDIIDTSEKIFGINRTELKDLRFQQYALYMTLRYALHNGGLPAATETMISNRLSEMVLDKAPYAGMISYFETLPLSALPWDTDIQLV